jgi:hypothetical protein
VAMLTFFRVFRTKWNKAHFSGIWKVCLAEILLSTLSSCGGDSGVVLINRDDDSVPDGTFSLANGLRWGRD